MKRYIVGLVLGLATQVAVAEAVVSSAAQDAVVATAPTALPAGVITEQHPLKKAYIAKSGSSVLLFRPSENMPEIVNEEVLRGSADSGKAPGKVSQFLGYLPKLTVLPCASGCEGSRYDDVVSSFLKGYYGNGKHFKPRGAMTVQVRWFHARPWIQRGLPYGEDVFGVSFVMEGKVVSLGSRTGIGSTQSTENLAQELGSRLGAELAYTAGMGLKPTFLRKYERNALIDLGDAVGGATQAVRTVFGSENVKSRIEPVAESHQVLLPAVDGILPGEIDPITEVRFLDMVY